MTLRAGHNASAFPLSFLENIFIVIFKERGGRIT